ncbi:MAG: chemotaxis protein CheA [Candidatus Magasanikbacteria bacterium]|jgi:two-component system, chemotaxis family, sensor kinase CheA|nr:chemotaxis protein CheA [Candidatus Magasanikbacteria bacterium]
MDLSQFKQLFISEAEEHIALLNEHLLALEKCDPANKTDSKDILNELMRSSHTIKGSAATMGFTHMAELTHVMEDVFDYARNEMLAISPSILDELFHTVDALDQSLDHIAKENTESIDPTFIESLRKLTGVKTKGAGKSERDDTGKPLSAPTPEPAEPSGNIRTEATEQVKVDTISHIKVPTERIDTLFDLVEELLIDKMKLDAVMDPNAAHFTGMNAKTIEQKFPLHARVAPVVDHMSQLVSAIQHTVMQTRLIPLGQVFARFPRMVRDLSKQKNKEINFSIQGSELELDRSIIDTLAEPLVHLLRNAIDHGIDTSGDIILSAQRDKNFTTISVQDSGNGINWSKVIETAHARGIISAEQKSTLQGTRDAAANRLVESLIFHPELSTNDVVTETSGRGVGLSVVDEFVKKSSGLLHVESPLQEGGTRFSLQLPMSLAIINALIVSIGGETAAIPFSVVKRSVLVSPSDIKSVGDQNIAIVQGIEVPLLDLKKTFATQSAVPTEPSEVPQKQQQITVVIAFHGKEVVGLIVDDILDEQEIIVKSLPPVLQGVNGFSGSTILGNGKTILILDVGSILQNRLQLLRA